MKTFKLILTGALSVALLAGCGTMKKSQNTPVSSSPSGKGKTEQLDIRDINKVLYGEWTAMNVSGTAVTGNDRPYVVFDTVASNPYLAKFYAYNGCNVINGQVAVTASGEMKKASDYLSTMKYCADAPYEIGTSMLLEGIASYKIEKIGAEYLLYLYNADKTQSMVLRRSDLSWLNGAWRVRRIGDVVLPEDAGVEMVIDIPQKHVHGNTGCNVINGDITCDPDKQHSIRFGNLATTRMMCPEIEREQQFLNALSLVTTAQRNHSDNEADLRDASGQLVMELVRIDLKAMRESQE